MRRFEELCGSQQFIADGVRLLVQNEISLRHQRRRFKERLEQCGPASGKDDRIGPQINLQFTQLVQNVIRIRLHSGENSLLNLIRQNGRPPLDHVGDVIIFNLIVATVEKEQRIW